MTFIAATAILPAVVSPSRTDKMTERPLFHRAQDELAYIRRTLEAAGHLTTIPGRGFVAIGLLALLAVGANRLWTGAPWDAAHPRAALAVWGALLLSSAITGTWSMARKARRLGQQFWTPVLRRAAWGYGTAMMLGGLLTLAVLAGGTPGMLPEVWLGCYGVALGSAGVVSVAPLRWMGASFLALAAAAVWLDDSAGLALLALGFGWLHIAFGAYIAWRHNG